MTKTDNTIKEPFHSTPNGTKTHIILWLKKLP